MAEFQTNQRQDDDADNASLLLLNLLGITSRAPPFALQYLTVRDLMQLPCVSRTVRQHLREIEYTHCKDGRLYKVPFPGFPGLLDHASTTTSSKNNNDGLFPHQLASLRAMHQAENPTSANDSVLRGGILADMPGLGKSITTLALITSTAGQRPKTPPEFWGTPQQLQEGWQALTQNQECRRDIYEILKPFRTTATTSSMVPSNVYQSLAAHIRPPFPLQRFPTMRDMERYIRQTVKPYATRAQLELFRQALGRLRAGLHKANRKRLKSNAMGRRWQWERSLIPTSATLLIVPDALLEHWFQQIHQHVRRELLADDKEECHATRYNNIPLHSYHHHHHHHHHAQRVVVVDNQYNTANQMARGVIYLDGVGDIADARLPLGHVQLQSAPLPLPWELSKYLVVITTFSRCEMEFQKEVRAGRLFGGAATVSAPTGSSKRARNYNSNNNEDNDEGLSEGTTSHLLKMRWLRVVVDEGHELGSHEGGNGVTRFIHQIAAERRWVLSGTPTTGDEDDVHFSSKALDQLQRLLLFLRHPVYGSTVPNNDNTNNDNQNEIAEPSPYVDTLRPNGKKASRQEQKQMAKVLWVTKVKEPFLQKKEEGRSELLQVLKSVMVMHRKEDINLPKPIFREIEVFVPLPKDVQANIRSDTASAATLLLEFLLTDSFQSLVDKAQGEYIVKAIQRAKEALQERGGPLQDDAQASTLKMYSAEDVQENSDIMHAKDRRPIKAVVYSSNKFNLRDVTEAMYQALSFENIAEAYDDPRFDCSAELSRFRHNRKEVRRCPICGYQNDYASAAHQNVRRGKDPTCQNVLMEVVKRDDPTVRFLVETERVVRAVPIHEGGNVTIARMDGLNHSQYGSSGRTWSVGDLLEVNVQDPHPLLLQKRESIETWQQDYGSEKCIELATAETFLGRDWFFGPLPAPPVLSEDDNNDDGDNRNNRAARARTTTMEVVLAKWQKCSAFHNPSRWYQGPTLAQVPLETIQEDVFILSLDAGLAHGLDLSFVTHIFLLEPVEDAALLEQITSRAHRLGATGPVTVETVNCFYSLDPATEIALEMSKAHQKEAKVKRPKKRTGTRESPIKSSSSKDATLTKIHCQYCYRAFDSMSAAVDHEGKQCPRNPANVDVVDKWHLSSLYREIKPPPPYEATTGNGHAS